MTRKASVRPKSSSLAVRAEAAAWIARLHSPDRSLADEQSFRRWLASSDTHARAFEHMTELWEAGALLESDILTRADKGGSARSGYYRPLAIAATLIFCVLAGVFLLRNGVETTRVGEQRVLILDDGTRITMNTATRLKVHYDRSQRRIELAKGEALFDVARNAERPFTVTVGEEHVVALGTSFVVRQDPNRWSVILIEGRVAAGGTMMNPGQRLTFRPDHPPALDYPALDKVTAWRRGLVALDNMTLADAIREMNRYSAVPLAAIGLPTDRIRVSGMFRAGDSLEFARALALTHGLSVGGGPRRIELSDPDRTP